MTGDGSKAKPFTQQEFDEWYANLLSDACEASEQFTDDELESYYEEWINTEEGKRFAAFAANIKWTFGTRPQEVDNE